MIPDIVAKLPLLYKVLDFDLTFLCLFHFTCWL